MAKVSVISATTGRPELKRCVESVYNQTHTDIQHIVVADGLNTHDKVGRVLQSCGIACDYVEPIYLQSSIGKDGWNGHRIYGGFTYVADGDFVMYLDDDNYLDPTHIEDCLNVIKAGNDWVYSLRKIVDHQGNVLCLDDCESLGKWASVCGQNDYFVDVNCYFLSKVAAVNISPIWHRKFRVPGQMEVDRALMYILRSATKYDCTYKYSVNYLVASNSQMSVKPEFFLQGNAEMLRRYNGVLPWKK